MVQELTESHEERGEASHISHVLCGDLEEVGGDLVSSWVAGGPPLEAIVRRTAITVCVECKREDDGVAETTG